MLAVAVVMAAPAGAGAQLQRATDAGSASTAGVRWRELDRGMPNGPALSAPVAFVALNRASTKRFSYRLPAAGKTALAALDFNRNAAVAIFAQFGCKDHRVAVASVAQRAGGTLVVSLVERQAIYPTYRLLAVPKSSLMRPYPTRSDARLG